MEGGKEEGNMDDETSRRSGLLVGSLRWDSGWQGGSWKRRKRRRGMGKVEKDMAAFG